ncbi:MULTISPECIES: DMT family transporter [Pacificimonas]|uniref:DMT family transporter n=1 Tax=Pacificimonas aurantium TaxID=1250540 RepID=A0ABS7WH53_9SPHN|nr:MULTISPECIES: DMT family transporter [Pacificimonas]MBZ6377739.1 DMT family transporter [Pacificimonas aurantium]
MTGPAAGNSTLAGAGWTIVSSLLFSVAFTFVKLAGQDIHPFAVVFWRCFLGALILMPFVAAGRVQMPLSRLPGHVVRASSGTIAMFATFYALANAPIATVQAITFAAPVFATVAAALFLGERLRWRRCAALGVGFAGVLIVLQPGAVPLTPGISAAIVAAVGVAFTVIAIKKLVGFDRPVTVVAWSFVLPIVPALLAASFFWTWPRPETWIYLGIIALFTLTGQIAMVKAFSLAEASAIMPYDFVRFGFIVAAGVLVFDEPLRAPVLVGGGIILTSSIYLAYREAQLSRRGAASTPRVT